MEPPWRKTVCMMMTRVVVTSMLLCATCAGSTVITRLNPTAPCN